MGIGFGLLLTIYYVLGDERQDPSKEFGTGCLPFYRLLNFQQVELVDASYSPVSCKELWKIENIVPLSSLINFLELLSSLKNWRRDMEPGEKTLA